MIFETVAHFEPLVAAELAPRCRTGVAWICWARCALSVGVVGLEMSRVSSPCVAIDEQMEEDRIDDDRTAPHTHESRPFPLASCSPSVLLTMCRGPPQSPPIIAPPETHPFFVHNAPVTVAWHACHLSQAGILERNASKSLTTTGHIGDAFTLTNFWLWFVFLLVHSIHSRTADVVLQFWPVLTAVGAAVED